MWHSSKPFNGFVTCDDCDVNESVVMLAPSIASHNDENLFMRSSASPHGGFITVASDDCKESDFQRGNPGDGAGSVCNWSSNQKQGKGSTLAAQGRQGGTDTPWTIVGFCVKMGQKLRNVPRRWFDPPVTP